MQKTYFTLDIFTYTDYDRIVFLDVDMVIDGDVSELFACKEGISACRTYAFQDDRICDNMNAGVFVINIKKLGLNTYRELLRIVRRGFSMPEQRAMNIYFNGKISWLPKKYNVEKRMQHTEKHKHILEEAVIIHYVATKPHEEKPNDLEASYEEIERIWWDYEKKHFNKERKICENRIARYA